MNKVIIAKATNAGLEGSKRFCEHLELPQTFWLPASIFVPLSGHMTVCEQLFAQSQADKKVSIDQQVMVSIS